MKYLVFFSCLLYCVVISIQSTFGQKNVVLWGTVVGGGTYNMGTIFKYDVNTNTVTIVYNFDSVYGGKQPLGALTQGADGRLYGIASAGGKYNKGTLFRIDTLGLGTGFTKLIDFDSLNNGSFPTGSLLQANNGKLYGTTAAGGTYNSGTLFSFDPSNTLTGYTKLLDFSQSIGTSPYGALLQASNGKLYGTCREGPNFQSGTIYSFDPSNNTFDLLHYFYYFDAKGAETYQGTNPLSLIEGIDGFLYGTTTNGGDDGNYGILYRFDLNDTTGFLQLHDIPSESGISTGTLIQTADGQLYGTANFSAVTVNGIIFSCNPSDSAVDYGPKYIFKRNDTYPFSSLMQASNQLMYGMSGFLFNKDGYIYSFDPQNAQSGIKKLADIKGVNPSYCVSNTRLTEFCDLITIVEQPQSLHVCNPLDINSQVSATGSNLSYQWFKDNKPITGANSPIYHFDKFKLSDNGSYKCVISNGCRKVVSAAAGLSYSAISGGNDTTICYGQSLKFLGKGGFNYVWSGGIMNNLSFKPSVSTNYILTGLTSFDCIQSDTVKVTVNSLPGINAGNQQRVCEGDYTSLTGIGGFTYTWTGGILNNVPFKPAISQVYTLTGTDLNGCKNSDTVSVNVVLCPDTIFIPEIPNVFTPNGDEVNDAFEIKNINRFPVNRLIVYNRWGGKVFEAENYTGNWKAENVPDGIYYYSFEARQKSKGWVQIIR